MRFLILIFLLLSSVCFADDSDIETIKKICPFGISRRFSIASDYLKSCANNFEYSHLNTAQRITVYKYLGDAFYNGDITKRDLSQAFYRYKDCAELDDVYCAEKVGEMYLRGDGITQSDIQAFLVFYQIGRKNNNKNLLMLAKKIYDTWDEETQIYVTRTVHNENPETVPKTETAQ